MNQKGTSEYSLQFYTSIPNCDSNQDKNQKSFIVIHYMFARLWRVHVQRVCHRLPCGWVIRVRLAQNRTFSNEGRQRFVFGPLTVFLILFLRAGQALCNVTSQCVRFGLICIIRVLTCQYGSHCALEKPHCEDPQSWADNTEEKRTMRNGFKAQAETALLHTPHTSCSGVTNMCVHGLG